MAKPRNRAIPTSLTDYSVVPEISKACLCGSTNHVRITHKTCPLNPRRTASTSEQASSSQSHETDEEENETLSLMVVPTRAFSLTMQTPLMMSSNCGRAHKRDCPLNPRNKKGNASKPKKQHVSLERDKALLSYSYY